MSLDAIRTLRRAGQKPSGVVTILLGERPRWLEDDATVVVVRPADDPRLMDWRPLVGLWVATFSRGLQPERLLGVLAGLESVGAKLFGAADASGAYPMTLGAGEEHRRNLQSTWELLCR